MPASAPEAIPLYPRRRLVGTASGGTTSVRRGGRSDVASSRPYRPGDHMRTIDWKASARLSSARDGDEFVVSERHAEEMPAVVVVLDRRPSMALYPADLPWLRKPDALRAIARLLVASATNQRSLVGYLDYASHGGETPCWQPPRAQASLWTTTWSERLDAALDDAFDAPDDSVELALDFIGLHRSAVPIGSFVFVVSDFIAETPHEAWMRAIGAGWDVVPIIVQDPIWEQSFPAIDGVLITVADAEAGRPARVRLSAGEVAERREANERRLAALQDDFARLGLDAVLIGSAHPADVHAELLQWAHARAELAHGRR